MALHDTRVWEKECERRDHSRGKRVGDARPSIGWSVLTSATSVILQCSPISSIVVLDLRNRLFDYSSSLKHAVLQVSLFFGNEAPQPLSQQALTGSPHSFFKTLVDSEVTVELKNDISIRGTLKSVDQYLNIKLDDITVVDELKYPHLSSVKNIFIRGSVVRYVHLAAASVDTALLEDATRRGRCIPPSGMERMLTALQKRHKQRLRHVKAE